MPAMLSEKGEPGKRAICAIPPRRIDEIIHGKRGITADTALRLSLFFGTSAEVWLNLQADYELDCVKRSDLGTLQKLIKVFKPAAAMS